MGTPSVRESVQLAPDRLGQGTSVKNHFVLCETDARGGAQTAYAANDELVVEWYDFGAGVPYESANLLILDEAGRRTLADAMQASTADPSALAAAVAARFGSWWDFKEFLEERAIAFRRKTDFMP